MLADELIALYDTGREAPPFTQAHPGLTPAAGYEGPVTVTVDYMRGGSERRGDTFACAVIERLGKRIANVEAVAWQTDRAKPIAAARINFLLDRP